MVLHGRYQAATVTERSKQIIEQRGGCGLAIGAGNAYTTTMFFRGAGHKN